MLVFQLAGHAGRLYRTIRKAESGGIDAIEASQIVAQGADIVMTVESALERGGKSKGASVVRSFRFLLLDLSEAIKDGSVDEREAAGLISRVREAIVANRLSN